MPARDANRTHRLLAARHGPLEYGRRLWLKLLFVLIFILLYAPIVTLIAFSFNTDKRNVVWPTYRQGHPRRGLIDGLYASLADP